MEENGNLATVSVGVAAEKYQREWRQKQKHRERARAYYLRHREEVIERAKNNYYRKQEEQKRAEETTEMYAGTAAEKDEKPEKSWIAIGNWGDLVGIAMIVAAVIWAAVLVIRELQKQPAASEALQDSETSDAPQEQQIPTARLSALIEQERSYAEIRKILAEAPHKGVKF